MQKSDVRNVLLIGGKEAEYTHYQQSLSAIGMTLDRATFKTIKSQDIIDQFLIIDFDDIPLPEHSARLDLIRALATKNKALIVLSLHASMNLAVAIMRAGASDFLAKPLHISHLQNAIQNCKSFTQKTPQTNRQEEISEAGNKPNVRHNNFIGSSAIMQKIYERISHAAKSEASIFITGESGTGKDVCAQEIHNKSNRKDKPFIALNCGAIPKDLIESEVFGHVKGSFTGAIADRIGAVEAANGGTLFLDEVCEMDTALQTKLLRFLQTNSYQRVGSNKQQQTNCRIICATNKIPEQEVAAGRFRQDLYYRLHVVPILMPALRERERDILELSSYYLDVYNRQEKKSFKAFEQAVTDRFLIYSWPGNVRELQNVIRQIVVLFDADYVTQDMLPSYMMFDQAHGQERQDGEDNSLHVVSLSNAEHPRGIDAIRPLAQEERIIIERALRLCDGNIPKAAALLYVSPSTLYRKKLGWEEEDQNCHTESKKDDVKSSQHIDKDTSA